ncbi:MAG: DUF1512 domain-containing protein [Thermoproteota archaeon]
MAEATAPFFSSSEIATWIIAISILISTILSIMAFLGVSQSMQIRFLKSQIEGKLRILASYAEESKRSARKKLEEIGVRDPDDVVNVVVDYFVVEPVSIEPTDIIKRLERVLRTEEERIESIVSSKLVRDVSRDQLNNAVTLLAIANALNTLYKYVRHILLFGSKTKNVYLIAQLWALLPMYLYIAGAYHKALRAVYRGVPIGDAAGPLVAYRLMEELPLIEGPVEVAKDSIYTLHDFEGRFVYVVRAKGPGSTVGRPGVAVEEIVNKHLAGRKLSAIITVDAALKFEGEDSGSLAEGSGVAMGDPGPEKIRIERIATRLSIPLYAIAVKMSLEEAINTMSKSVLEGVEKAVEKTKKLILDTARPGEAVIVVGVGNSIGVGLPQSTETQEEGSQDDLGRQP